MCGINGILHFNTDQINRDSIKAMNNALSHRGPDDEGIYADNSILLGHRRLSIIDVSSAGHQPFVSFDKRYVIVYNGELYNYKELKFELMRSEAGSGQMPYPFKTNSDTEVVLASFIRWGEGCLTRFNGMYAFAVWDTLKNDLFIARDRMGIKPLYFYQDDNKFLFSSEIRSILASDLVPRKLNHLALSQYMQYQTVYAPDTMVKGVQMLRPGHFIALKNKETQIVKYWQPHQSQIETIKNKTYKEICSEIQSLFIDSVQLRMVSDVPFGAFLSGGIDSSSVVAAMSSVADSKVNTFSVTFDDKEFSEAHYSDLIAKKYNTQHHEIKLTASDFLNALPDAISSYDHPGGDGMNTYIVSKAVAEKGIKMALSGQGGDEVFAGYSVFNRVYQFSEKKHLYRIPLPIRKSIVGAYASLKKGMFSERLKDAFLYKEYSWRNTYSVIRKIYREKDIEKLLGNSYAAFSMPDLLKNELTATPEGYLLSAVSKAEMITYLQNVLLRDGDQMSMAHALEVRVPFLDYRLVEYVLSVSDKIKYPTTPKKLLTDAMGNLIPDEIIHRTKMGFVFPWKKWLKYELKSFTYENIMYLGETGYFNKKELEILWSNYLNDNPYVLWTNVWHLAVLGNWMKKNRIE